MNQNPDHSQVPEGIMAQQDKRYHRALYRLVEPVLGDQDARLLVRVITGSQALFGEPFDDMAVESLRTDFQIRSTPNIDRLAMLLDSLGLVMLIAELDRSMCPDAYPDDAAVVLRLLNMCTTLKAWYLSNRPDN